MWHLVTFDRKINGLWVMLFALQKIRVKLCVFGKIFQILKLLEKNVFYWIIIKLLNSYLQISVSWSNIFSRSSLEASSPLIIILLGVNKLCITESFNTNISHQLFDYTITFVNSQHKNTNSKGDFVLKPSFKR